MNGLSIRRSENPYKVERTPRGCVVFCEEHLITDELKPGEAHALARSLNMEYQTRMLLR
jgi:hypothetical protein